MAKSTNLQRKGMIRSVLYVVLGLALGVFGLLADNLLATTLAFGLVALFFGFLVFAPKERCEDGFLRLGSFDPTMGSPKVSDAVVVAVLLSFFTFLIYVAFKHHI
jgi:hypothetical protein